MKIEILYVDGCPNHEALVPHLTSLLTAAGIREEVSLRRVGSHETAMRERFLGSPTLRVDGRDVERGADERTDFAIKCRLFATPDGLRGIPMDDWIRAALARAAAEIPGGGQAPPARPARRSAREDRGV